MLKIRHLNIDKAINTFLENVDGLSHLPFVTDVEMTRIYGQEVEESLEELALHNLEAQTCLHCTKKCCTLVNCELYDPGLSQCPVYDYRPALCRMHFCDKFLISDISFIREFADIFLNSLIEAKRQGSQKVLLFDCPPLSNQVPEFVRTALPWIAAFKEGKMDETSVQALIRSEIEKVGTSV